MFYIVSACTLGVAIACGFFVAVLVGKRIEPQEPAANDAEPS